MENEDKKTLAPELLPAPAAITSRSPRQRVTDHFLRLKQLGVVASAAALANCGYLVVDPLPPPAQCRTVNGMEVDTSANRTGGAVHFQLLFRSHQSLNWAFGEIGGLTGATLMDDQRSGTPQDEFVIAATFLPEPGAGRIDFTIPVDCSGGQDGGTSQSLITVSIALPQSDGGADDGGWEFLEVTTKVASIR